MLTWKLVGVGRLLLMVVLALAPLAPGVGKATPELYDKVASGTGDVPPGASVPGGGPGMMPGMHGEHHH